MKYGSERKLSPHDLTRMAIAKALDQGLTHRPVAMMSGRKDAKTVMNYDHGRENLEQNAINFIENATKDSTTEAGNNTEYETSKLF